MIRIIEKSSIAKIAAWVLKSPNVAITFGNRIFLYNAQSKDLLANTAWLRHELKHVEQYQKLGFFGFLFRYIWYSIKHGYYLNPLEIEARLAESDSEIINRHQLPA